MNDSALVKSLIQQLSGTDIIVAVKICDVVVKSVDKQTLTCIVNSVDPNSNIDGLKIRLCSEDCDGDVNYPEIDENITIAYSDILTPIMINYSWLSEKSIIIGNQKFNIINGKTTLNSDDYGGIPIVKDPNNSQAGLLAEINRLENKVNDVVDLLNELIGKYNLHTHILTLTSGTGTAAPTLTQETNVETPIQPLTSEEDISNPNIVHGKIAK